MSGQRNKPSQGTPRVFVLEKVIGRCDVDGGSSEGAEARFWVQNPSVRLHLSIHCFARPSNTGEAGGGGNTHDYSDETWQLYVVARNNPDIRCNAVFVDPTTGAAADTQLPDMYEGATGAKVLEGVVQLSDNGNGPDDYVVQCIWEPESGGERMSDLEFSQLTALCGLTCPKVAKVS